MHPELPLGALVSLLHRNHFIALNNSLRPLGLFAGQFPILLYLSRKEGAPQEALARHFHIDKATVARAVQRLVKDGFVCRRIEPGNRRAYGLYLTEKGKEIIDRIRGIEACWEEELLGVLPEAERREAIRLVRTLAEQSMRISGAGGEDDRK